MDFTKHSNGMKRHCKDSVKINKKSIGQRERLEYVSEI